MLLRVTALAVILSLGASAQSPNGNHGGSKGGAYGAPEINSTIAGAGIVLLVGGVLVLTGRRRAASVPNSEDLETPRG